MQPIVFGEIACRNVAPTFGLKKHVETTLNGWSTTNSEVFPSSLFYEVTFDPTEQRQSKKEYVTCQIKLVGKFQMFMGSGIGRNTREAFARAMLDMKKIYECLEYGYTELAQREPARMSG